MISTAEPSNNLFQSILPIINLGIVLNFGFISIFVVNNLFKSTYKKIEKLKERIGDNVSELDPEIILTPEAQVLADNQNKISIMFACFYPCVSHNLIHVLAVFYGFMFLIFICFRITLGDFSALKIFHINLVFSIFVILEATRIIMSLNVSDRKKAAHILGKKNNIGLEEEFFPLFFGQPLGMKWALAILGIFSIITIFLCQKINLSIYVSDTFNSSFIVVNLFLIFLVKILYNIVNRFKIQRIEISARK